MSQSPVMIEPAPRPLTRSASSASWREAEVRTVLLVALGILVVIFAVGVRDLIRGIGDRILFRNGVLVEARVENIDGANRNVNRNIQQRLRLSFVLPGETERRTIEGFSTPMPGTLNRYDPNNPNVEGSVLPIRIDPKDLSNWTERAEPIPWLKSMIVPLVLTPPALILLGLVAMRRGTFARIYRTGTPFQANVIGVQRSALVPGQRLARVAIVGGEGRVLRVTVPASVAPAEGQTIDVLATDINASRALSVAAYR